MVEPAGSHVYTLVVSQYEKSNTIHFTLRVFATNEVKLTRVHDPYVHKYQKQVRACPRMLRYHCSTVSVNEHVFLQVVGEWKGHTAGGCGNYKETHNNNPVHQLKITNDRTDNMIKIELRGPK